MVAFDSICPMSGRNVHTGAKPPQIDDQPKIGVHVYRVSGANKAIALMMGVILFCIAGWLCSGLFVPYLRARFAHEDMNSTANLVVALALSGFALFSAIRPLQMHLTITNSQVEVVGAFSSHTVPFAEISGRRIAAGRGVSGMYLYRRGKSRVFLRESSLRLDDFYKQWKASIYDLDKADKLKRMEAGKERAMDFVFDDREQHPAIGGPDIIA
jgi:hypothetical protein